MVGVMRIYVAGSSKETERCEWAMDACLKLGVQLTMDWIAAIEEAGAAHPSEYAEQLKWSNGNVDALLEAHVFWGLVPKEEPSLGLFWEFGAMRMRNKLYELDPDASWFEPAMIILSGPYAKTHFFTAQADMTFFSDVEGLAAVQALCNVQ
jgi:hypothetical protein